MVLPLAAYAKPPAAKHYLPPTTLADPFHRAQMHPQFAHRLVFLIANPFRRQRQLRRDVLHRPAFKAHPQNLLLPFAEQLRRRLLHDLAVLGSLLRLRIAAIAHHAQQLGRALAAALRPLLNRVDGPQKFAAFLALAFEGRFPAFRGNAWSSRRKTSCVQSFQVSGGKWALRQQTVQYRLMS